MSRTTYGYQFKKISKHDLFPFKVGRRGYCESLILSREMEEGLKRIQMYCPWFWIVYIAKVTELYLQNSRRTSGGFVFWLFVRDSTEIVLGGN